MPETYTIQSSEPESGTTQYRVSKNGQLLSNREFIDLLSSSDSFIQFFNELLKTSPYEGYFWELKPVNENSLNEALEFVLVESNRIAQKRPDPRPFLEHLEGLQWAAAFGNLGKNAQLVAPAIAGKPRQYAHIAGFVRNAPDEQIKAFWQLVGQEFEKSIGPENKWLSTAGFGVSWLHVRIDQRPKYYRHKAYKFVNN
ncbi:MAG: hypothetical protein HEP71_33165 [Roseivirga sp.]|nr:hypothetical protein [Roseivirga sp.]